MSQKKYRKCVSEAEVGSKHILTATASVLMPAAGVVIKACYSGRWREVPNKPLKNTN